MYSCKKKSDDYFMVFSAIYENVDLACEDIKDFLERQGLDALSFTVLLGARETINNAIRHGAKCDEKQKIKFRIYRQGNRICMQTWDPGQGFRLSLENQDHDTILKESGHGLHILHNYFNSVIFNATGNCVNLELDIKEALNQEN